MCLRLFGPNLIKEKDNFLFVHNCVLKMSVSLFDILFLFSSFIIKYFAFTTFEVWMKLATGNMCPSFGFHWELFVKRMVELSIQDLSDTFPRLPFNNI